MSGEFLLVFNARIVLYSGGVVNPIVDIVALIATVCLLTINRPKEFITGLALNSGSQLAIRAEAIVVQNGVVEAVCGWIR